MKKLLGFASLLLIALLTACADNLDEIAEAGKGDVVSEADRVPVQLSISPSPNAADMTRAPLASGTTAKHNFSTPDGQYLGIFALAQTNTPAGNITGPVATENIKWDGSVERACLLWNQPAKADSTNQWQGEVLEDYYTAIHLLNPASLGSTPTEVNPSYPLSSWYNYYFYAYYPRVDDSNVHVSNNNVVTADYTLDGSQDIITGIAKPSTSDPDVANGYCGKYFRSKRLAANGSLALNQTPQLELNHHLAQLRFFVRSKMPAVGTFQMKEITLLDVPTQWSLTIADKSDDNNRGTLTSRSTTTANIPVREITVGPSNNMTSASDEPVYDGTAYTALTTTPKIAGYAMVPTTAMIETANSTQNREFATSYQVKLTIRSNDEVAELTRTISTPEGGFLYGRVYNVIINVDQSSIEDLEIDPREVDMGFPSKTKWACMNIGASTETDLGETNKQVFAWAATEGHKAAVQSTPFNDGYNFTWENTPYYITKHEDDYSWSKYNSSGNVLEAVDDYASISWGGKWRLPTSDEIQELINYTNKEWETKNGVVGMTFTSKINGNSIFMPATGYRLFRSNNRDLMYEKTASGYYWSSTLSNEGNQKAMCLKFTSSGAAFRQSFDRNRGILLRAVKK